MRFGILGPLAAWRLGEEVEIGGPRVRLLLALLLLDVGRLVPTSRLVDGLWGEHPPRGAANALQSLISRLRSSLEPDVAIESRPGGYVLAISPDAVDAQRFTRLAEDGRQAIAGGDPAAGASLLREALALWRGAPLADLDGPGVEAARARLEGLRLAVSEDRIEAELATGDHAHLIPELATLTAGHPLNERLRGLYMRALHGAGRQADALTVFEETRRMLGEQLGADPSDELQRLHVAILRRDPALERKDRAPTNLRAQLTSFVGRKDDLARVAGLLQSARLVTLVGAGGAGKTRLAMELAARLVESTPDGVWVVELAPLSDGPAVTQAVLSALGVREAALVAEHRAGVASEPVARLIDALATRRLLLVLDNCEHLVHAVAGLAETILAHCPGLRILTTSREPLAVSGEALWQVPPLGLPPADAGLESVSEWDSVRLLLDRATAVNPGFTVDAGNLAAIIQVCRRLDGMPLAIELAAARLRSLTIEQIADRLDDRFTLLTGGSRTALPRHQTLRAVVDWSWDLLDPAERILLRRLSVFAGGAALETVEAVCGDDELDSRRVLDLLTGLVDKSLVEVAPHRGGMRYRLLETVRAYAAERLGEAGESTTTRAAHAGFFCELAERADPELRGHDQLEWLRRLDDEHDNVRAALAWALEARDATLALRLTVAMWTDWSFRGSRAESRQAVTAAVELPGDADPWLRASGLVMHALHVFEMGRVDAATDEIERARSLYGRSARPPHPIFVTLAPMLALLRGDVDSARAMVRQVATGRSDWTGAMGWLMAGYIASAHGGTDEAEDAFDRAAARFRAVGDRWGLSQALTGLSSVAEARGEPDRQAQALREALQQVELLGAREDLSRLLITLGSLEAMRGDSEQGLAQVDEGMRVARELGSADALANGHFWKGSLARRLGNLTEARHQFERGLAIFGDENRMHPFRAMALVGLGFVAEQAGDLAAARARHLEAAGQILAGPFMPIWTAAMLANVVDGLAGVAAAGDDPEEAALLVGAASGMRTIELRGDARWDVDRITQTARRVLGEERFAQAHQRGAALTYEEIVARITT